MSPAHPVSPAASATPTLAGTLLVWAALLLAATVPTLLAFHQPPSSTVLNQCVAVALWGGVAMVVPQGWAGGS